MTFSQLSVPTFPGITATTYQLHGQMLGMGCTCSTCTCVSCGCFSLFDNMVGYRIEQGWIGGIDVSGITLMRADYSSTDTKKASTAHTSGTILYIAEQATEQQREALVRAFTGQLGGVLADLAHLLGDYPEIRFVPMHYHHENGQEALVSVIKT
ncbi:MAG: DUF1326 domain-containing protein [Symploca sp. SIO2B6]|nr:DUF1326 domain-containing protein [Symploca sp. SIO2B6]